MLIPFADDAKVIEIAEKLTVENGRDAVLIRGELEITKDKVGLQVAEELLEQLVSIIQTLRQAEHLPDKIGPAPRAKRVRNPLK